MIKNVIFDMGNVLLEFNPRHYVDMLDIADKKVRDNIYYEVYHTKYCTYLDRGDLTEEMFIDLVIKKIGEKYRPYVERLIFNWADDVVPIDGMAKLIKELKDKGYKIYLLSNAGYRQHEYWNRIPGHDLFDGTIVSCDYKCVKPERKIYETLFNTFNLKPEECFFIDDLPINIYGAIESGMEGYVFYGDVDRLREELHLRGIL